MKGKVSKTGYRKNSPDRSNDFNIIPSGNISMFNVPHNVFGIDNFGNRQMMLPGGEYKFPGNYVTEFPVLKQQGGQIGMNAFDIGLSPEDARQALIDGHILGHELSSAQRTLFAQVAGTDEDGNIIEDQNSDEEMRRGGQHNLRHRNQTSKNIKSSVNELFLRNHNVYGPSGKHIYNPKAEKGGEPMKHLIPMPPHVIYMNGAEQNPWLMQMGGVPDMYFDNDNADDNQMKHGGNWIQKAVNPAHKGYCTPMTKSTCTPKRKAFAMTMKKHHGFHQMGGEELGGDYEDNFDNPFFQTGGTFYKTEAEFHAAQKTAGNQLIPGSRTEYINPKDYVNTNGKWSSPTGAPISGNYPQNIFGWTPPTNPTTFNSKPSNFVDTSNNHQQWVYSDNKTGVHTYKDTTTGKTFYKDNQNNILQPNAQGLILPVQNQQQITATPTQKYGGQMQDGGEFLKAIVKNAYKDVMKKGGQSSPQGMSSDDVRTERSNNFKNYLSNNAMKAIALEEIENLNQLHHQSMLRYGGDCMQEGGQMSSEWMKNMGYSDGSAGEDNFIPPTTANAGVTSNPAPPFYSSMSNNNTQGSKQNNNNPNWMQRNGTQLAEGIVGTENFFSSVLNARNTRSNENILKQRMDADNMFSVNQYGSANRGDYDVNSGTFKPNQFTPVQNRGNMKMGGQHEEGEWMTAAEIKKLKAQGYHIEFLD